MPIFSITLDHGIGVEQEKIHCESIYQNLLVKRNSTPLQLFPNHLFNGSFTSIEQPTNKTAKPPFAPNSRRELLTTTFTDQPCRRIWPFFIPYGSLNTRSCKISYRRDIVERQPLFRSMRTEKLVACDEHHSGICHCNTLLVPGLILLYALKTLPHCTQIFSRCVSFALARHSTLQYFPPPRFIAEGTVSNSLPQVSHFATTRSLRAS